MKTIDDINARIREGRAVVVTASEMKEIVERSGPAAAAERVDVVTTGTFAPMCSSGLLINTGHSTPRMKYSKAWLNGVPAYAGLAAVDLFLGATSLPEDDPRNAVRPGAFRYGGGHVIEDLVRGREVRLRAEGYGTDCYPRRELVRMITLGGLRSATLLNPRNCYQNYAVAVNAHGSKPIHTYMGTLMPGASNASYCSAGELSPLLNDPFLRTVGVGTRIFLGGGTGLVIGAGTQHSPGVERNSRGIPVGGACTLAVSGDLGGMNAEFVRGVSVTGYGSSLAVGIGIPIPVLDEDIAFRAAVRNRDIQAPVVDFSRDYPEGTGEVLGYADYEALRSGSITLGGRTVRTVPLSSMRAAERICTALRRMIEERRLTLAEPVEALPA